MHDLAENIPQDTPKRDRIYKICRETQFYLWRKEKNYSLRDMADMMNVSRECIRVWENGKARPKFDKIIMLADIFGVKPKEVQDHFNREAMHKRGVEESLSHKDDERIDS